MNSTCRMKGSEFLATAPIPELLVGTVRQARIEKPSSSAIEANFASDSWW